MDIAAIIGSVIAFASAVFAGWQAWEAMKARKSADRSQREAAESSKNAAHSAEVAAEAQKKLAAAQEVISEIVKKREAANRRNVVLRHTTGNLYAVVNETGETITNVKVIPTKTEQSQLMRASAARSLSHGDGHEVLLPYGGMYEIHWVDSDGHDQKRTVNTAISGA